MTTTADTQLVPLERLAPSKLNPRQHFDEEYNAELQANIAKHGVLENLLARPDWCKGTVTAKQLDKARPKEPWTGGFEIVSGECRWRAAKNLKLADLPVRVKELTDPELEELNLAEQLARKDLTPIEEARSFKRLLAYKDDEGKPRHTADSLAASLGFANARPIYARLKLLDLPEKAQKALVAGELPMSVGQYIARIPAEADRAKAAREIMDNDGQGHPMSAVEAREHIAQHYMRELKGTPFDQEDKTLVPEAGPCSACPFRTGNNKALFGDVKRGDICTSPGCFERKRLASLARATEAARKAGKRVLSESESEQIFPRYTRSMAFDSPLALLDSKPEAHLLKPEVKNPPTWRELAETAAGQGMKVEVLAVTDQSGVLRDCADRALLIAAAEKAGEPIFRGKQDRRPREQSEFDKRAKEEREKTRQQAAVALASARALTVALAKRLADADPKLWAALGIIAWENLGGEGAHFLGKMLGAKLTGPEGWRGIVAAAVRKLPADAQRGYVPLLLVAEKVRWHGLKAPGFAELAAWAKVDLAAIEKETLASLKTKAKKARPAKRPPERSVKPAKKDAGAKALAAVRASIKKPAKKGV